MLDRDVAFLVEVKDAVGRIQTYVAGLDRAAFLADERTGDAVAMQLTIIGEAARALSHAARAEADEIPWIDIVAVRNRIVHGYKTVDREIVWEIITRHLTPPRGSGDALARNARRVNQARIGSLNAPPLFSARRAC